MKDLSHLEPFDYLIIPWRRKWYFLSAMILILAATALVVWLRPEQFRSEVRIQVESATVLEDSSSPLAAKARAEERMDAIREYLGSRTALEQLIREVKDLYADSSTPMEDKIKGIRNSLEISKNSGNVFTMAYVADSPEDARRIASGLAKILINTNQLSLQQKARDKDEFIDDQLNQAKQDLKNLDDEIKKFKDNNLGQLPEQSAANMNALNGLNSQLVAIESSLDRDRDQEKSLIFQLEQLQKLSKMSNSISQTEKAPSPQIKGANSSSRLESLLDNKRAQLTEAMSRFTQKHPDVIRLTKEVEELEQQLRDSTVVTENGGKTADAFINAPETKLSGEMGKNQEVSQIDIDQSKYQHDLEILRSRIDEKDKERTIIQKNINLYQNRLNDAPKIEQGLAVLIRDRDAKQEQVSNLENRKFNAKIALDAAQAPKNEIYSVLDEASLPDPKRPIFPTHLHIILMGIGMSLVAGYGAAIARELIEPSLSSEEEVTALLKLPVLASVPEISRIPRR